MVATSDSAQPMTTLRSTDKPSLLDHLNLTIDRGQEVLTSNSWNVKKALIWFLRARVNLIQIYGPNHTIVSGWATRAAPLAALLEPAQRSLFHKSFLQFKALTESFTSSSQAVFSSPDKSVFIGHGGSKVWLELQFYLEKRLTLPCSEFNTESVAGVATSHRLDQMLDAARFAFLIMTAEDKHADGTMHARPNVIHEIGLFQGRLGARRAIILREDGCSGFSNASGLTDISFPPNHLEMAFDKIRHVLEREHILLS